MKHTAHEVMQEVKDLIAFYEARGWDWLLAAEFTLRKNSGSWPERTWWERRKK